jgi:rRNA-processing protein FCF1
MESFSVLDDLLITQQVAVTFKSLSRKINVSVNEAKRIMKEYSTRKQLNCNQILYCLQYKTADKTIVKLISGADLKDIPTDCVIHIHALYPGQIINCDAVLLIDSKISSSDTFVNCSRIVINKDVLFSKVKRVIPVDPIPTKYMKSKSLEHAPVEKLTVKKSNSDSKVAKNKKSIKSDKEKLNHVSTVKLEPLNDSTVKLEPLNDSTVKLEPSKVVWKGSEEFTAKSKKSLEQQSEIKMLFDQVEEKKPVVEELPTETKRVRKKRKVIKSETVLQGKYMKTVDVEHWESYSDDEIVHKPNIQSEKKIEKNATGPKQRSINSFFKKRS